MGNGAESGTHTGTKRVLLVDDHPIVRQGLALAMQDQTDLEVCGQAESASEAIEKIAQLKPDIAVIDLALKNSSGLELIKDINARFDNVLMLVLSMRDEGFYAERVLRAGARGYVTKSEGFQTVLEAIRTVLHGKVHVSPAIADKVMNRLVEGSAKSQSDSRISTLTDRELEVFTLIGNGMPTREVAEHLHISPKTVDSHREHIKSKLDLDSATDLLKHAIQWVQMQQKG
ncbi:MAG: response regulator [Phycisphaerae bacterium]